MADLQWSRTYDADGVWDGGLFSYAYGLRGDFVPRRRAAVAQVRLRDTFGEPNPPQVTFYAGNLPEIIAWLEALVAQLRREASSLSVAQAEGGQVGYADHV